VTARAIETFDLVVRICGPCEGLRHLICFGDEAVDGGLEVDDGSEDAAVQSPPGRLCEEAFTALTHEHEVGVKWNVKRLCRSSQSRTLGCR
jgi:hypothetical protein